MLACIHALSKCVTAKARQQKDKALRELTAGALLLLVTKPLENKTSKHKRDREKGRGGGEGNEQKHRRKLKQDMQRL